MEEDLVITTNYRTRSCCQLLSRPWWRRCPSTDHFRNNRRSLEEYLSMQIISIPGRHQYHSCWALRHPLNEPNAIATGVFPLKCGEARIIRTAKLTWSIELDVLSNSDSAFDVRASSLSIFFCISRLRSQFGFWGPREISALRER
jgi:hypothetical protein